MDTATRAIHNFAEGEMFDNRYRLVARAGSGGFADVWRAEDTLRNDRVVALKIYTRLDDDGIKQMSLEYDETEYIQHPNLLTGNHFAAVGNIPYMEMRYCDGGSLAKRVGAMDSGEIRHVLHDVLSGLAYLHSQGIVHQDIKPENILHDSTHNVYMLADFGISGKSRTRLSKSVQRDNNSVSMTLAYAPPEKFSSNPADREPSTKGDIFSLGVTLYELATGTLPFEQPVNTGERMLNCDGKVNIYFDSISDPVLRQIVQRCIQYRKANRPTAEELLAMLNSSTPTEESDEVSTPRGGKKTMKYKYSPITSETKPLARPKNNWWIYVVVVAVAIALGFMIPKTCANPEPKPMDTIHDTVSDTVVVTVPAQTTTSTNDKSTVTPANEQQRQQENAHQQREQESVRQQRQDGFHMEGNTIVYISGGTEYRYKMVYVSGGSFIMGALVGDNESFPCEKPQHNVTVGSFYIGQTEVPQWLWNAVMGNNPCYWKGNNLPVEQVSYNDVTTFISKLNGLTGKKFRLPIEEEWEFAARGGNRSRGYKYSGSDNVGYVAWYTDNSGSKTHPVGQKPANELGLYDMTGNVWEWCNSYWRNDYNSNPDYSRRVVRDGSWGHYAKFIRISYRSGNVPTSRDYFGGFRLAL